MQQRLDFSPTHMEWLSRNSTSGLSKGKEKKKSPVLLMWYFAIRSAALLRLLYQWLPSVSWLYKACLEAANNCQQETEDFKRKENVKLGTYLFCPRGSQEPWNMKHSGEEEFGVEASGEKLLRESQGAAEQPWPPSQSRCSFPFLPPILWFLLSFTSQLLSMQNKPTIHGVAFIKVNLKVGRKPCIL